MGDFDEQSNLESQIQPVKIEAYSPTEQIDIAQIQKAYDANPKPGTKPVDSTVLPSFDARPINAYDFRAQGGTTVTTGDGLSIFGAFFSFQVPNGYRGLLRGFSYELGIIIDDPSIGSSDIQTTIITGGQLTSSGPGSIFNNGSVAPGMVAMELGQIVDDLQPCYVLAESGDFISIQILFSGNYQGLTGLANDSSVTISLYGNLLLSTGRTLPYEPGLETPVPVANDKNFLNKRQSELISTPTPTPVSPAPVPMVQAAPPQASQPAQQMPRRWAIRGQSRPSSGGSKPRGGSQKRRSRYFV